MRTGLRSGTIDAYFPEALFASAAGYIPPLIPRHPLAHREILLAAMPAPKRRVRPVLGRVRPRRSGVAPASLRPGQPPSGLDAAPGELLTVRGDAGSPGPCGVSMSVGDR